MTARSLAAQEFVAVFEWLIHVCGIARAAALRDPRLQAARRRYIAEVVPCPA